MMDATTRIRNLSIALEAIHKSIGARTDEAFDIRRLLCLEIYKMERKEKGQPPARPAEPTTDNQS